MRALNGSQHGRRYTLTNSVGTSVIVCDREVSLDKVEMIIEDSGKHSDE